ncbi:VOC family protein [Arenicella xantha]|uniref:VOC domain-containing protein n=1 Tax=Arenicella xantha TaxID=644221 RepID=A0A395JT30_9GAMM|nr:VOC family protein [Arenicella xantha]RBP53636.1 hypothetical protein DFR28_1011023 [Arenicella xantha]
MTDKPIGAIEWRDLTVDDADSVKDFYAQVVGWNTGSVSMGDYDDYTMSLPGSGETIAGVCHARGSNAGLPPQWMMYVRVADADASANRVLELGGEIIQGPRTMAGDIYYMIKDPAGAVLSIFSSTG